VALEELLRVVGAVEVLALAVLARPAMRMARLRRLIVVVAAG
jgi:hypothetical protein